MNSDLLKRLMQKAGDIPGRFRSAMLGGDEAMAGAKKAFRSGGSGPAGVDPRWGVGPGGKYGKPNATSDATDLELYRQPGGALSTDVAQMSPLGGMDKLKMLLARMTPAQRAALLAGGAGVGAGGLGGYLAGGSDEEG